MSRRRDWQPMQLGLDGAEVPHELGEQEREPGAVQLALEGVHVGTVDAPSLFDAPEVVVVAAPAWRPTWLT